MSRLYAAEPTMVVIELHVHERLVPPSPDDGLSL